MGKIIAIINQKGGVGKTTVTFQVGAILRQMGYKVLLIDMDPQCNLSCVMRANLSSYSILDALLGNVDINYIIQHCKNADIVISNGNLASYDQRFEGKAKEYRFKEVVSPLKDRYDFILVDSPPALGVLTVGILTASDGFVIPAAADIFSAQGIEQIYSTYEAVKLYTNPDLKLYGVLFTRYNYKFDVELYKIIMKTCKKLGIESFLSVIKESATVRESLSYRKALIDYAPDCDALKDYKKLANILVKISKGGNEQ